MDSSQGCLRLGPACGWVKDSGVPAGSPPLSLDSPGWRWLRTAHLHDGVCVTRVLGFSINSEVGVDLRDVPWLT